MDTVDIAILEELRKNARIANNKLAEKVHLSPSAVLERVRHLKESGVIKDFVTRLNPSALGYGLSVFIRLQIEKDPDGGSIAAKLGGLPEIVEIYDVAGDCDYILKAVVKDSEALRRTLQKIYAVPGVLSSRTSLILATLKSELPLPPDLSK